MTKSLAEEMQRTARQALAGLQPATVGEEAGGLPVRRLVAAFFRARYLVFGTTLFGILVGLFMAITTANSYVSTGKFLFTSAGAESSQLTPTQAKETSQETIATGAAYILNSDDLLMRVVRRLGPARILQPYQPGDPHASGAKALFFQIQRDWNAVSEENWTEEEALKRLQKTIFVERPRYTDVLIATCNANNEVLAREILHTFMDESIKWHIEKYDDQKAYEEAEQTLNDSVSKLDIAQRNMREFLDRKAEVPEFDDELKRAKLDATASETRLNALLESITIKKSVLEDLDARLADPERLPQMKLQKVRKGSDPELIATLKTKEAEELIKLTNIKATSKDGTDIARQERALENVRAAIRFEQEKAMHAELEEVPVENPAYKEAVATRDRYQGELVPLEAELAQVKLLHEMKLGELRRMLELEPDYEALRGAVALARDNKQAATITWEAAKVKKSLKLGNYSSLKVVQQASLPLEKEGPNRSKLLMGGFFVGLFLGLGLIVLRALPDSVVRTRDDLEQIEGLAVIGVMPRLDRTNLKRHQALREQGW